MDWHAPLSFFSHVSLDWVVLVCFALLVALDALRGGLSRATALSIALPLSLILLGFVPDAQLMGGVRQALSSQTLQMLFDGALLVVLFIIVYRMTDTYGADSYHPLQALLAGGAVAVVATVVWLQIPALNSVWHFGAQIQSVFGAAYRFWWFLAAYIALAFARG